MKTVKISSFLKERKIKFKPEVANYTGLQRIEKIDFSGKVYLSPVQTNTDMILVKPGDLVISGINVEKGALAIYTGEEDVLASIHYSAYEFDAEKIDIDYLKWFLKSGIFRKLLLKQTGRGIKKEIKAKHFLPIEIQLPSLNQQHEVVRQIQGVADYIVEINQQIEQQTKYMEIFRQTILQQAIEGKLCEQNPSDEPASVLLEKIKAEKERLIVEKKIKKQKTLPPISNAEKPFVLPKGWEWCRLGEILYEAPRNGYSPPKVERETNTRVLTLTATTSGILDLQHYKYIEDTISESSYLWIKQGDLLIQRSNSLDYVGTVCLCDVVIKGYIYPDLMMKAKVSNKADSHYIVYYLKSPFARQYFKDRATGTSNSMKKIKQSVVSEIPIALPPINEQKQIVAKMKELFALNQKMNQELLQAKKYASQLMESVLQEAFSVQETEKSSQVIEFYSNQTTSETELLAAARGKIREDTWEHLCKRALEIAGEEC